MKGPPPPPPALLPKRLALKSIKSGQETCVKLEKATVRIRKGTGDWFKTNTWTEENWFEERKKDIAELVKKGKGSAPPNGGGFGGEESAEIQDLKAQIQDLEASNANFRQNCTWLTSELLDLRISNTQQSQRLANAADTSSASMREAAAEILSLSDAYERSKTEERRLLAALEQSTERNMATNAKLSVTQARLTGYAREIDVLERRLRDVADELRVTEEELRTTEEEFAEHRLCDSSGSDDEDTATPAIAIAVTGDGAGSHRPDLDTEAPFEASCFSCDIYLDKGNVFRDKWGNIHWEFCVGCPPNSSHEELEENKDLDTEAPPTDGEDEDYHTRGQTTRTLQT